MVDRGKIKDRLCLDFEKPVFSETIDDLLQLQAHFVFDDLIGIDELVTHPRCQTLPDQSKRGIIGLKKKDLKTLFQERRSLYQKYADITVELTEEPNLNAVLEEVLQKVFQIAQ